MTHVGVDGGGGPQFCKDCIFCGLHIRGNMQLSGSEIHVCYMDVFSCCKDFLYV